jgi:hypothetical protein
MHKSEFGINYSGVPVKTRPGTVIIQLANLTHVPHDHDQTPLISFDIEFLRDDHAGFLLDDERSLVGVGTGITWRSGQVSNFEPELAVHVHLRIDDAALLKHVPS